MSLIDEKRKRPLIIAGPCSAESREQVMRTCSALAATGQVDMIRAGVWKPRTMPGSFEGPGEQGLVWLGESARATGLPFGVEVANAAHVETALKHGAGMVWLGARTTVSPFSVQEIADALRGTSVKILIKNPLTPDTALWSGAVERIMAVGVDVRDIGLIHRGFPHSGKGNIYRNPPMWHLAIEMRQRYPDMELLCDPSHICGNRENLADISQKAADLYYDGLFIESHIEPDRALSDALQQLTPAALADMLGRIRWRSPNTNSPEFAQLLEKYRREIDDIDAEIFGLFSRRMAIADDIGRIKKENDVTILQKERWSEISARIISQADRLRLSPEFMKTILDAIHIESIAHQNKVMNDGAGEE